ncbi:hypothetical protein BZA77DRAFT_369171 [Pyronema omphalodes]|nr:hypothetical protein BZA77DRAFT_369171 [Pyronema omphalodes]
MLNFPLQKRSSASPASPESSTGSSTTTKSSLLGSISTDSSSTPKPSCFGFTSAKDLVRSQSDISPVKHLASTVPAPWAPVFCPGRALPQSRSSQRFTSPQSSPSDSTLSPPSYGSRGSRGSVDSGTSTDATEFFEDDIADATNYSYGGAKRSMMRHHQLTTIAQHLAKPEPVRPTNATLVQKWIIDSKRVDDWLADTLNSNTHGIIPGLYPQHLSEGPHSDLLRTQSDSSADTQETLEDPEVADDGTALTRCHAGSCNSNRHSSDLYPLNNHSSTPSASSHAAQHNHFLAEHKTSYAGINTTGSFVTDDNEGNISIYDTPAYPPANHIYDGLEDVSAYEADDDDDDDDELYSPYHSGFLDIDFDDGDIFSPDDSPCYSPDNSPDGSRSSSSSDEVGCRSLHEGRDVIKKHRLMRRYRPSWTTYADIEVMPTVWETDEDMVDLKEKESWWKLETENMGLLRLKMELRRPKIGGLVRRDREGLRGEGRAVEV